MERISKISINYSSSTGPSNIQMLDSISYSPSNIICSRRSIKTSSELFALSPNIAVVRYIYL